MSHKKGREKLVPEFLGANIPFLLLCVEYLRPSLDCLSLEACFKITAFPTFPTFLSSSFLDLTKGSTVRVTWSFSAVQSFNWICFIYRTITECGNTSRISRATNPKIRIITKTRRLTRTTVQFTKSITRRIS